MNQTTNYQLSQWEASDRILMNDFNDDNAKIDAALKANADAITAEAAARTAAVGVKADATALTAEISARQAADEALAEKAGAQLIATQALPAANSQCSIDLSGIDWSDWLCVLIHFAPAAGPEYQYNGSISSGNLPFSYASGDCQLLFCPMFSPQMPVCGICWASNGGGQGFYFNGTFQNLTNLSLQCTSGTFAAGTTAVIYGTK